MQNSSSPEIYHLQAMINSLADNFDNIDSVNASGIYDNETRDVVRDLQVILGIPDTGNLDSETWNGITNLVKSLREPEF